jgi:hypothetical protein
MLSLFMRFINTGDVFYMSYVDNSLQFLDKGSGFLALFKAPLGALRIVSWDQLPVNLGLQLFWYHYDTDLMSGPNSRHNVFGLFYFGFYGSILFSFFVGFVTSYLRNVLFYKIKRNMTGMVIYVFMAMISPFLSQDFPGLALDKFLSFFIIFPVLYFFSLIVYDISKRR